MKSALPFLSWFSAIVEAPQRLAIPARTPIPAMAATFVGYARVYSRTPARVSVEMASCLPDGGGIPLARKAGIMRGPNRLKQTVFSNPLARRHALPLLLLGCLVTLVLGCQALPKAVKPSAAGAPAPLEVVNEPLGQGNAVLAARREGIGTLTCAASGRFGWGCFARERIVAGTDTGVVAMFSEEGKQLWRRQCSREIQWLGLHNKRVFAGDADGIAAFNGKGRELWRRKVPNLQIMAVSPQRLADGMIATVTPRVLELIAPDGKTLARVESATLPGDVPRAGGKTFSGAVVGDVNGDGRCEVAAYSYQAVFLFDRPGELLWSKAGREYDIYNPEARIWYLTMAVSDLNADGKDELLIATNRGIAALDAEGTKIWSTPTNYGNVQCLAEGDMDGDGKKEIAVGSTSYDLHVYGSDGALRWTAPIGSWTSAVAMADLDHDGREEVLAAGEFQAPDVLAFDAAGKVKWRCPMTFDVRCFAPVGLGRDKCRGIAACGDDLTFLDPAGNLRWIILSGGPHKVAVADLNGDGAAEILDGATGLTAYGGGGDLLWTRQTGTVWDLAALGAGAGRKSAIAVGYERQAADLFSGDGSVLWRQKLGWIRSSVLFDDVDADGSAEVVVADNQTVYLYGRDGRERWKFEDRGEGITYWVYCAAAANLNGGRDRQILVGSHPGVHALGADGTRLWDYTEPNSANALNGEKFALIRPNSIAAADLNGDGREEVVVTAHSGLYCFSPEGKVLWLDRNFRIAGNPRDGVHLVHCADLTGDGIPEIIVGQNVVAVLDAAGKIIWSKKPDLSVAELAVGDVDGDGRAEIVAAGKELCVFAGDGTEKLRYAGSARFRRVALGDVDGDGVNEIIVGGAGVYVFKMTGPLSPTLRTKVTSRSEQIPGQTQSSPQVPPAIDAARDRAGAALAAADPIMQMLKDRLPDLREGKENPERIESMVNALAGLGDPRAIPVLEETLAAARVYEAKRIQENPSMKSPKGGQDPSLILVSHVEKALQDLGKPLLDGLEATISTSKPAFRLGEPIIIQYEMKNAAQQTRTVCFKKAELLPDSLMSSPHEPDAVREIQQKLATGGVVWQFIISVDRKGPLAPMAGLMVTAHAEWPPAQRKDFMVLSPGESYRCTMDLLDYDFVGRFSKPGQYTVYVEYENPYSGEEFGLNVWHSHTGPGVWSNRVSFAIR